jgi:hypothetical protein
MKRRGLKRLKGCGANSGIIKARVKGWRITYDRSTTYDLKPTARKKNEPYNPEDDKE